MPIYAYKCESCGYAKDVLQKMSDAPLTDCPECGAASFKKQLTAAGFQLKGSGWYVTDFRGGDNAGGAKTIEPAPGSGAVGKDSPAGATAASSSAASTPAAAAPVAATAAPASSKTSSGDTSSKSS